MVTIRLDDMVFCSPRGWYPQERLKGNRFGVDLHIDWEPAPGSDPAQDWIDYEGLYELVSREMDRNWNLLEEAAQSILDRVHELHPRCRRIRVQIRKQHPPLLGQTGSAAIGLEQEF